MIGMVGKTRPINFSDLRMLPKVFGDSLSVAAVPLHAQVKGLDSTEYQEAILRAWNGAARVCNKEQLLVEFLIIDDEWRP